MNASPEQRSNLLGIPIPSFTEVAAAFVAVATFVVALGAFVLWIRVSRADVPQIEALSVMPRELYILAGVQGLVIPTGVMFCFILLGSAAGSARREIDLATPSGRKRLEVGQEVAPFLFFGLAISVATFLPFTVNTMALAAFFVAAGFAIRQPDFHATTRVILVVGLVYGTTFAVTRELEGPVRLPEAEVVHAGAPIERGRFVASSSHAVYLGGDGDLRELRADGIKEVTVQKVPDDDPPASLWNRFIDLF